MTTASKPKINAIAPWYGGNRQLADRVGEKLEGCEWVGIPFAGGMAEIGHIKARTIVANDLHLGVVLLADYIRRDVEGLTASLQGLLVHPATLAGAQSQLRGGTSNADLVAIAFFVVAWMTRSGAAGTDGESTGKLCLRWEAGGGDSAKRWQSAIDSLPYWAEEFKRCTFSTLDCFEFLGKCKDRPKHGIYCDPPFPGPGDKYTHKFTEADHKALAERLGEFLSTRIVCRYYDHPLVRELYPESEWEWHTFAGRTQANKTSPEVLLVRNGA